MSPRRGILLLLAVVAALVVAGPAAADVRDSVAVSPKGATMHLDGTALTVTAPAAVLAGLQTHKVQALCMAGLESFDEVDAAFMPSATPGVTDFSIVGVTAIWPADATSLSVTLPRDVSAAVDMCTVGALKEDAGIMGVFDPDYAEAVAEEPHRDEVEQRLVDAYVAAKVDADDYHHGRFKSATTVARAIRKVHPRFKVAIAKTTRGVRRRGVVYVVASKTGPRRGVLLASRAASGDGIEWVREKADGSISASWESS